MPAPFFITVLSFWKVLFLSLKLYDMKHNFDDICTRKDLSPYGGGFEISLDVYGFEGHCMAVYQNYLGGDMLGKVGVNDTLRKGRVILTQDQHDLLDAIGEDLKKHFFNRTLDFQNQTYAQNQQMPLSAY